MTGDSAPTAQMLRELPGDPGLAIAICDGIEHWDAGEIMLTVHGSGIAEVRHRRAGSERRYDAELDAAQLERFAARMSELGFAGLESVHRDQVPDELETSFLVLRDGAELLRAQIPDEDVHDDPRLAAIMQAFEALVEQVTGGDLPHGPAAAPR